MHILKQKLMAVTQYIPPKPGPPLGSLPPRAKPALEVRNWEESLSQDIVLIFSIDTASFRNCYDFKTIVSLKDTGRVLLLKKELNTIFQECKMIAVIQDNATNAEDMLHLKHRLHKHGITIKFIPNQVMIWPG